MGGQGGTESKLTSPGDGGEGKGPALGVSDPLRRLR